MTVAADRDEPTTEEVPGTVEVSSWWLPFPDALSGVASIGGVFGLIPFDRRRFDPSIDAVLLRRDRAMLMMQFKRARERATRDLEHDGNGMQQRLFDPDTA
jgi:hypothetical protein